MNLIRGLHHLTACVNGAQEDIDFHTKVLGLRLIKQTVLLDGEIPIYHLYYTTGEALPGTILTTFPYKMHGIVGRRGYGQIKVTSYSVPSASLPFWMQRFETLQVPHSAIRERFGQPYLRFWHPCGIEFEMMGEDHDQRLPWVTREVAAEVGVRGLHHVALSLHDTGESERFMELLGFRKTAEEGASMRFEVQEGGAGNMVEFVHEPDAPAGSWTYAAGTVHHVAFAVDDDQAQQAIKDTLGGVGYIDVSEQKDRNYFRSMYFRMPGGVLFELAIGAAFTKDEPADRLGQRLMLPAWFEPRREEYAERLQLLEPISV